MKNVIPIFIAFTFITSTGVSAQSKSKKSALSVTATKEILPSYTYFEKSNYRLFYHTIKPNETPLSIAQLYKLPVADVKAMNNLKTDAVLPVGQELLLEDRTQKKGSVIAVKSIKPNQPTPSVAATNFQPKEIVVSEIKVPIETNELKVLKIENTEIAQPTLVHFIETEDIARIQKQALSERKMLFINFYSESCLPCKIMQESTFKDQDIAIFMDKHSINVHVDGMTEGGKALRTAYAANAFPTLLFFNAQGDEVARHEGSLGIEAFKQFMNSAYEKAQTVAKLSLKE